ncbi:MAG: hypothetical protein ACO36A_01470 [Ilumatobacteraceae bacterium]
MTHISSFVSEALASAGRWTDCSPEPALVYACEDIAVRECPLPSLSHGETAQLVGRICLHEDTDVPHVHFHRRAGRCIGWAHGESHTIGFSGAGVTAHTVAHEIAHLTPGSSGHDGVFRAQLVGLARRHIGIEYAALLHSLFRGVGLDVPQWQA